MHYWVTPKGYFIRAHNFLGLIVRYYLVQIRTLWSMRRKNVPNGCLTVTRSLGGNK
jgi:hypothetical protein